MKLKHICMLTFASLFLQACASPYMSQEVQSGKTEFTSGNYKQAFHDLLPIAVYGRKEAQYAVGYMYYNGLGVAQDTESGIFWITKSAEQKYVPAMEALKQIKGPP